MTLRSSVLFLTFAALVRAQAPPVGNQPQGWVVIPLKDYDQLRARIAPPPEPDPESSAADATLTRVDYHLRVEENRASGRASVTIDVLRDGWVQVPLPPGLYVREARVEPGGALAPIIEGAAAFSKKGRYLLQLSLAIPIELANGEERLTLPAGGSGITRANLTLARGGIEVTAAGGIVGSRSGDTWQAFGRGQGPLVLSWRRKLEEHREELPLRQRGKLLEWVSLGEDSTAVWAEVTLDILQGTARKARLRVPDGVTVNQAPGANVADWDLKNGVLEVGFLEPADKQVRFLVQGEAKLPRDGAFDVPVLRLLDVERESGGVGVEVAGSAEVKGWTPQGLERTEAVELGPWPGPRQSASLEAFRFRTGAGERALKVEVARYTPQAMLTAIVEEARVHALAGEDGKTLVRARYAVRNNQRNFLKLTLPAGAVLWTASLEGRPAVPGQGPEASLMLPLSKSRAGEDAPVFAVEVLYFMKGEAWGERGRAALPLPKLDLPVSRSSVVLFHPPRHRVTVEPGAFRAGPFAAAESPVFAAAAAAAPPSANAVANSASLLNSQLLVDRFRARRESRQPAGSPLNMAFPSFGPSLFLSAQLTGENTESRIELSYRQERRGGEK